MKFLYLTLVAALATAKDAEQQKKERRAKRARERKLAAEQSHNLRVNLTPAERVETAQRKWRPEPRRYVTYNDGEETEFDEADEDEVHEVERELGWNSNNRKATL